MNDIILYDYWRSSAAYRVRIALNLKQIDYKSISIDIANGEQKNDSYLTKNPQGLVPILSIDGYEFIQSMAIIDYLDRDDNDFYPTDPVERAKTFAHAMIIAADIHPLNNLRILKYLRGELTQDDAGVSAWYHQWILDGFKVLETYAPSDGFFGGDSPNIVDICLVPQIYNARRFETPLADFPKLVAIDARCNAIKAFIRAIPENVKPSQ